MSVFVALLRAVNVPGRSYRMAELREHLTSAGLRDVETYIQTGNVRFRTSLRSPAKVEQHVEAVLRAHSGFEVPTVLLTPEELRTVHREAMALPVPESESVPVRRYLTFFKPGEAPAGEVADRICAWDEPGESAAVLGRAVHLWLAHSLQDARFHGAFRKALAPGTARDLKVVTTLAERWGA
jgi:uncharacterized protein (DUF1697 family)